jgi:hypothetical protein
MAMPRFRGACEPVRQATVGDINRLLDGRFGHKFRTKIVK